MRIGKHVIDPPYLLAPMAGVSEMPFRVLALEMGAGLATTELVSAKGIFYRNRRTRQYLTHNAEKERPYSVQLFGGDPESMAVATQESERIGADIVDINMGCPVKKVTKTGAGSALLAEPQRAADLVRVMREAVSDRIPITAKIRSGFEDSHINCVEMTQALEAAGCAALAIHPRTRTQKYAGDADWTLIAKMKEASKEMPIIGNGDVRSVDDALRMERETRCDAVMVGRGAMGNPWIFRELKAGKRLAPPSPDERCRVMLEHLRAHIAFHHTLDDDENQRRKHRVPPEEMAVRTFRQHLIWYSRGLPGGSAFRKTVTQVTRPEEVETMIRAFFGSLEEGARYNESEDAEGVNYKQAFG